MARIYLDALALRVLAGSGGERKQGLIEHLEDAYRSGDTFVTSVHALNHILADFTDAGAGLQFLSEVKRLAEVIDLVESDLTEGIPYQERYGLEWFRAVDVAIAVRAGVDWILDLDGEYAPVSEVKAFEL